VLDERTSTAESLVSSPEPSRGPSGDKLLREFTSRHGLKMTGIVRREGVAIRAVSQANYIVTRAYAEAGANEEIMSDPAIGLLLNMLHRNFEMTEASLVAFVTGSGAAAEVAARASVESSVNILYILTGSRASRLQAYFESYFSLTDQEVRRWQAETTDMGPSEAAVHLQGIKKRLAANEALRNMMRSVFGVTQEQWPKNIVERLELAPEICTGR